MYVLLCVDHSNDLVDAVQRKLTTVGKGPIDAFTIMYKSGQARKLTWRDQIEAAVHGESDEFWHEVCR